MSPPGEISTRGERYVISEKSHPGVNFTSPTCNMPLSKHFSSAFCFLNV